MMKWFRKLFGYPKYLKPATVKKLYRLRVWKLGSLEHRILPTEQGINALQTKLKEMFDNWDGKSDLDLIWGPELTVETHLVTGEELNVIAKRPDVRLVRPEEKIPVDNGDSVW